MHNRPVITDEHRAHRIECLARTLLWSQSTQHIRAYLAKLDKATAQELREVLADQKQIIKALTLEQRYQIMAERRALRFRPYYRYYQPESTQP